MSWGMLVVCISKVALHILLPYSDACKIASEPCVVFDNITRANKNI
jgi:hypothetical protein